MLQSHGVKGVYNGSVKDDEDDDDGVLGFKVLRH